jgi:hypothetical protein
VGSGLLPRRPWQTEALARWLVSESDVRLHVLDHLSCPNRSDISGALLRLFFPDSWFTAGGRGRTSAASRRCNGTPTCPVLAFPISKTDGQSNCAAVWAAPRFKLSKSSNRFQVHHRCSAGQKAKPTKGENEALWLAARIDDGQITNLAVSETYLHLSRNLTVHRFWKLEMPKPYKPPLPAQTHGAARPRRGLPVGHERRGQLTNLLHVERTRRTAARVRNHARVRVSLAHLAIPELPEVEQSLLMHRM